MALTKADFHKRLSMQLHARKDDSDRDFTTLIAVEDDRLFLEAAYNSIFNRHLDPDGEATYLNALRRRVPRREILQTLASSPEALTKQTAASLFWRQTEYPRVRPLLPRLARFFRANVSEVFRTVAAPLLDTYFTRIDSTLIRLEHLSQRIKQDLGSTVALRASETAALTSRLDALQDTLEQHTRVSRTPLCHSVEVDGLLYLIPPEDIRLATYMKYRGLLEPGMVLLLRRLLKPGMVVVDIGANIGVYTLEAARILGPNGSVHSFEPTPNVFALLQEAIQLNGFRELSTVHLHSEAVYDSDGVAQLLINSTDNTHNHITTNPAGLTSLTVKTVRLDSILEHRPVDVIKLDAEGAEPEILLGMTQILEANPQVQILMEVAPSHLARSSVSARTFLTQLETIGFTIRLIDDITGSLSLTSLEHLLSRSSSNIYLSRRPAAAEVTS